MANINWKDLLKNVESFEPVPAGDYEVSVQKAESTTFKSGNHGVKVTFQIDGGPHNGRKLFWNCVLNAENPNMWFRNMKSFGMKAAFFGTDPNLDTVANVMVGKKARASVNITTYNGQEKNEVKWVNAPAGGAVEVTVSDPGNSFGSAPVEDPGF